MKQSLLKFTYCVISIILLSSCSENSSNSPTNINTPEIPAQTGDNWQVSSLDEQGIDSEMIAELSAWIEQGEFGEIHSMQIARHGYLVFDEYYRADHNTEFVHPLASVTKSVASVLIGIAVRLGYIESVDQTIDNFFPEHQYIFESDPQKRNLTIYHLLTMSAGFDWSDGNGSVADSDEYIAHFTTEDVVEYSLSKPIIFEPDSQFDYNGACSILLSAIIENVSGIDTDEFAETYLFTPLGISDYYFQHMHDGHTDLIGGLALKARDLLKIGQLFLNNGNWNGEQIISAEWIEESVTARHSSGDDQHYGYQWWLRRGQQSSFHSPSPNDIIFASGFGGEKLYIIPALDLTVVFTGNCTNYEIEDNLAPLALELYIIPAIGGN